LVSFSIFFLSPPELPTSFTPKSFYDYQSRIVTLSPLLIPYPNKSPLKYSILNSVETSDQAFVCEISRARTFGFQEEYDRMKQVGLARGASLDNVVAINGNSVLNPEGLRFPDEFVRHKILDCIGDFSLLGMPILGHIMLNKSEHAFNHAFLEQFFEQKNAWETRTINDLSDLIPV